MVAVVRCWFSLKSCLLEQLIIRIGFVISVIIRSSLVLSVHENKNKKNQKIKIKITIE